MDNQKIVMDGPKTQVLDKLQGNGNSKRPNKASVKISKPIVKVISNKNITSSDATPSPNNDDSRESLGQDHE